LSRTHHWNSQTWTAFGFLTAKSTAFDLLAVHVDYIICRGAVMKFFVITIIIPTGPVIAQLCQDEDDDGFILIAPTNGIRSGFEYVTTEPLGASQVAAHVIESDHSPSDLHTGEQPRE
jgi:hypothetical protein